MCVPNLIKIGGGREFHWLISYGMTLIQILFHEVLINKCICHGFYFIHGIQFTKLNTVSEVALKSEVRAVDGNDG